jgi:hypothetical protein
MSIARWYVGCRRRVLHFVEGVEHHDQATTAIEVPCGAAPLPCTAALGFSRDVLRRTLRRMKMKPQAYGLLSACGLRQGALRR